jgi:hypothetical protein
MKFLSILLMIIIISACGGGSNNNGSTSYYSASSATYYQIESQNNESFVLNIVNTGGNSINNIPLVQTSIGFTFASTNSGNNLTGSIVIKNNLMGIAITSSGGAILPSADFATTSENTNTEPLPNGTYTTVCDRNNISACTIIISGNQIYVTEYNSSGKSTTLCSNTTISQINGSNPYLQSFVCGVQGGIYTGNWYIMPLVINGETGLMINEYKPNVNISNSVTNEIAFLQATFSPNGIYNYVYNGISNNISGISTATFSSTSLINSIVGSCAGAACALIQGQYAGSSGIGNVMTGFDYYNVNGIVSYNLVGSTQMNIFVDSFSGIYY